MPTYFKPLVYLIAGLILFYMHWTRKNGYTRLTPEMLPSLAPAEFDELKNLMRQTTNRMLFLALAFIMLSSLVWADWHEDFQMFGLLVVGISACLNIAPRHRLARFVFNAGINIKELKKNHIRL